MRYHRRTCCNIDSWLALPRRLHNQRCHAGQLDWPDGELIPWPHRVGVDTHHRWRDFSADGGQIEPDWHLAAQPAPDYEVDQRVNWCGIEAAIYVRCGGSPASAPAQKPADTHRLQYGGPWTALTTAIKAARMSQTRAILGLMWLNFLSVCLAKLLISFPPGDKNEPAFVKGTLCFDRLDRMRASGYFQS